jgi:hypothetical protein
MRVMFHYKRFDKLKRILPIESMPGIAEAIRSMFII